MAVGLVLVDSSLTELDRIDGTQVVGSSTLVVECHRAITLEVASLEGVARSIDWKLLIVDANTVTVGVCVREQTRLEDWVRRGLDARDQVRWAESDLLDLGEVVDGVLIESELTDLAERELLLWPNVSQVEDVDLLLLPEFLGLLRCHGLNLDTPLGELATLDGLVQVLLRVVW